MVLTDVIKESVVSRLDSKESGVDHHRPLPSSVLPTFINKRKPKKNKNVRIYDS